MDGLDELALGKLKESLRSRGLVIRRELGTGGFGVVYLAEEVALSREVAVKVARPRRGGLTLQLRDEARSMARIRDPHVVQVLRAELDADPPFLVMEFVNGTSLDRWLADSLGGLAGRLAVFEDIVRGVCAIHAVHLVHCDLSPRNILLEFRGDSLVPKIADFGLARVPFTDAPPMGTRRYMAPEVPSGEPLGPTADVYSLGVILYELMEGYPAQSDWLATSDGPGLTSPRLTEAAREALGAVVRRALDPKPQRRFADAIELATELGRVLDGVTLESGFTGLATTASGSERSEIEPEKQYRVVVAVQVVGPTDDEWWDADRSVGRPVLEPVVARYGLTPLPSSDGDWLWLVDSGGGERRDVWTALMAAGEMLAGTAADAIIGPGERSLGAPELTVDVRIAIHAGPVLVEPLGERLQYRGRTLRDAATLAASTPSGHLAFSEVLSPYVPLGRQAVLGGRDVRLLERGFRLWGSPDEPFVAREYERQAVRGVWRRVETGLPEFVLLDGEAGMGKSRLAAEVATTLPPLTAGVARPQVVFDVCGVERGSHRGLMRARITDWAGLRGLEGTARSEALSRWLAELTGDEADPEIASVFQTVLEQFLDDPGAVHDESPDHARSLMETLIYLVRVQAGDAGVVWVIDNLELIDPTSSELLRCLLEARLKLLIIGTVRTPRLRADDLWLESFLRLGRRVPVSPLTAQEVGYFLREHPDERLHGFAAHAELLTTWASGNPLLIKGLVWSLARRQGPDPVGQLRAELSSIHPGQPGSPAAVERTAALQLWLREVTATLGSADLEVLQTCALLERPMLVPGILAAGGDGLTREVVEEAVRDLTRQNLLAVRRRSGQGQEDAVQVTVPLLSVLLRRSVDPHLVHVCHQKAGAWFASAGHESAERAAWHFAQAGDWCAAASHAVAAGCEAQRLVGAAGASPHLDDAANWLDRAERAGSSPELDAVRLALAQARVEQVLLGASPLDEVDVALALAERFDGPQWRERVAALRVALARVFSNGGAPERALEQCHLVIDAFAETSRTPTLDNGALDNGTLDNATLASAHAIRSWCLLTRARDRELHGHGLDTVEPELRRALGLVPAGGLAEAEVKRILAQLLIDQGRLQEAETLLKETESALLAARRFRMLGLAQCMEGYLAARAGRIDDGRGCYEKALRSFSRIGDADHLALCRHALGDLYYRAADFEHAEQQLTRARRLFSPASAWRLVETLLTLAMVRLEVDETMERGLEDTREALQLVSDNLERQVRAEVILAAGRAVAGQPPDVTPLFERLETSPPLQAFVKGH